MHKKFHNLGPGWSYFNGVIAVGSMSLPRGVLCLSSVNVICDCDISLIDFTEK